MVSIGAARSYQQLVQISALFARRTKNGPIFGHLGEELPGHATPKPRFLAPLSHRVNVSDIALPAVLAAFAGRRPTPEQAGEQHVEPVG